MKIILSLIFCTMIAVPLFADAPNGLAFLKIPVDVRSSAMGETGCSAGNSLALSVNPALLSQNNGRIVSFVHQQWIFDTSVNYLQAQFSGKIDFAFSALSTGVENIEVRTVPAPVPQSHIDSRDLSAGITVAKTFMDKLSFGITGKYLHEHIYYQDTEGWGIDLGAHYKFTDKISAGASVLNWGKMSVMDSEEPQLPRTICFGAAYKHSLNTAGELTLAAGGNFIREEELRGNMGLEWTYAGAFALRTGYLFNYDERGLTTGLGLKWKNLAFDYAYVPFQNDLGNAQKFGISVGF